MRSWFVLIHDFPDDYPPVGIGSMWICYKSNENTPFTAPMLISMGRDEKDDRNLTLCLSLAEILSYTGGMVIMRRAQIPKAPSEFRVLLPTRCNPPQEYEREARMCEWRDDCYCIIEKGFTCPHNCQALHPEFSVEKANGAESESVKDLMTAEVCELTNQIRTLLRDNWDKIPESVRARITATL